MRAIPDDKQLHELMELAASKMDPVLLHLSLQTFRSFLQRVGSAAPRARDEEGRPLLRWQDGVIAREIAPGESVLDLGCGTGDLLAALIETRSVRGQGVELDQDAVIKCIERGVPVFHADLDQGLVDFSDDSFDHVILEETLQTLHNPMTVLREMLRVGRRGIISFPNFAYWRVRLDLASRGRMPVTEWLPYKWHNTPNIHLFTIQDFMDWAKDEGVEVLAGFVLSEGEVRELQMDDNLYAEEALLFIRKGA